LAKYFAACLIPLLAVYAIASWRSPRWGLLWFLVPVAGLLAFERYTHHLYGGGALGSAVGYATTARQAGEHDRIRLLTGLSFVGGCMAPAVPVAAVAVFRALRRRGRWGWFYAAIALVLFAGLIRLQAPAIGRFAHVTPLPLSVMV